MRFLLDRRPRGRAAFIGMVHLEPLPGSPGWRGDLSTLLAAAERDADALRDGGCDALIVENMGDLPYLKGRVGPETVAAMTLAVERVVRRGLPVGVQVLAGANAEALGVALAAGAGFIRAEGFAYAHVADEGIIDACAGPLLRRRRALGAPVAVWADVQKKHAAHAITGDLSIAELAHGAVFCGADVLVVTGRATGAKTALDDVRAVAGCGVPVVVGSGVTPDDAAALGAVADGLVVGSWLKYDGDWRSPVDPRRVERLREALDDAG